MQISGSNLLQASQQVQAPAPAAAPGFASALQKMAGFIPRDLTKPEAPPAEPKPAVQTGPVRPGQHVDMKV